MDFAFGGKLFNKSVWETYYIVCNGYFLEISAHVSNGNIINIKTTDVSSFVDVDMISK